jgi:hypothetical protein
MEVSGVLLDRRRCARWRRVSEIVQYLDLVPVGVWATIIVGNLLATIFTRSWAGRRVRRVGAAPLRRAGVMEIALTVAAMVPAGLFWLMVLAGSLHGLVAFGRDVVGWRDGWEYLVPGTLDGVSVTFAFLAFRARGASPSPAGGTTSSSTVV